MPSNKDRQSLAREMSDLSADHEIRFATLLQSTDFDKDFIKILNETKTKAMVICASYKDPYSKQVVLKFIHTLDDQLVEHEKLLARQKAESDAAHKLQKKKEKKAKEKAKQKAKQKAKEELKKTNQNEDDLEIHIRHETRPLAIAETKDESQNQANSNAEFWKEIRSGFLGGNGSQFLQDLKANGNYEILFPSVNLDKTKQNEAWFEDYVKNIDLYVKENVTRFLSNPYRTNIEVLLVAKELDSSPSEEDIKKIHKLYQVSTPCDDTFQSYVKYIAAKKTTILEQAKTLSKPAADIAVTSRPSNSL